MEVANKAWDETGFMRMREEVLAGWATGKGVCLAESFAYHKALPETRVFSKKLARARDEGIVLAQPRAGVALLDEHIELLEYLQEAGEADLLSTTIDSYTRQNRYEEAQNGIEMSLREGRSMLNGLPAVNYGVPACRRIIESLGLPVQVRHGTPDARLLAEITLSAGFTAFEGGGISYNVPYAKNVPLSISIRHWQYVDRLVGLYEANGVSINREPFGPLTGTLVPPCISHSVGIIEAILAAEQGVKNITLGYGQCGNLIQDVAALKTLKKLGEDYLKRFGHADVTLTTVFHQWMGGFPQDEPRAYAVISWGAAAAALGRATKVITKTPHEAFGVPTKEANAAGLKATKQILQMLKDQELEESGELEEECEVICKETQAILEAVIHLGEGDVALGAVRSFEAGVIDVPFAPSRFNLGKTMPARDNAGAVRFLRPGNLPFPDGMAKFHRDKIAERGRFEGRKPSFQMVVDDIYAISKGMLVGRPMYS